MVQFIDLSRESEALSEVKEIYQTSFPSYQQMDFDTLVDETEEERNHFYGVYDGETLCGMTYVEKEDGMLYVKYLAVSSKVRSQGYGSKILQGLKETFADSIIFLDIETVDGEFENSAQREKRQAFYFKNGFVETNYHLLEDGETYDLLASSTDFSIEGFKAFMSRSTFPMDTLTIEAYK